MWLAAYSLAATLALYTLYYAGFLILGLALAGFWQLRRQQEPRGRLIGWLSAQIAALLLYLPWLIYAAPRLVPYVSQKVVADSDRPLHLVTFLARHLAAFSLGHLEGPLASWWPLGLLGLLPLLWLLIPTPPATRRPQPAAPFLLIVLATTLLAGWLINRSFPFFPDRGERLLLIALPAFLLLIASAYARPAPVAARLSLLILPLLASLSLAAFYLTPRYPQEDYRPLIGQINQWGRPDDTVFCVFPWQVGYFRSYGSPNGPQAQLSPDATWGAPVAAALDASLARGQLWFPEHLALGGLLESAAEEHLSATGYNLANRWYSPSTRLTGWAAPPQVEAPVQAGPIPFAGGAILISARFAADPLTAANDALLIDLHWQPAGQQRHISLRLSGPEDRTWAQQDILVEPPRQHERIGLLIPAATPPGLYDLLLSLRPAADAASFDLLDEAGQPAGHEARLGQITIVAPETPPPFETLPLQQPLQVDLDSAVQLAGLSGGAGPTRPGDDLQLSLFWQALPGLDSVPNDLFLFLQLLDREGQVAAAWEGPPVPWQPTSAWQPGQYIRSQQSLRLPATVTSGSHQLIAGLFDPANGQRLRPAKRSIFSRSQDFVTLAQIDILSRQHSTTPPRPQHPLNADLISLGKLVGYDLSPAGPIPGQPLDVTLYWQASETSSQRLKVFVHLLTPDGRIIAQSDQEPGRGDLPTSSWLPGEYLADRHTLLAPTGAQGPFTLAVGLFDPASGQRLPWLARPADSALLLPLD